jgi:hypothetical protein
VHHAAGEAALADYIEPGTNPFREDRQDLATAASAAATGNSRG